jgi:HK97 family phage prohead protease
VQHLLLKAATTATDQGTFTAVISTATIDRDGDIVEPSAMVNALAKWASLGKLVPLAWNHTDEVIGHIDPATATVENSEVVAKGWIDQSTDRGQEAWRLVKSGTFSFSFGYLIPKGGASKLAGGRFRINQLDVFEISGVPIAPANNDTRVLSWKAMGGGGQLRVLQSMAGQAQEFIDAEDDPADIEVMTDILEALQALLEDESAEPDEQDPPIPANPPKALIVITRDEKAGFKAGEVKAVWSASYVDELPDSAFLYIEDGGSKDDVGKTTPRSLRRFPYKDADGSVDLPHLRNALARIPQSNLPQDVKDTLTAKAQRILDSQKSADPAAHGHKSEATDPLRKRADALELEFLSDGVGPRKSPPTTPRPEPEMSLRDLKARMREEMLTSLSGGTQT